MIVAHAESRAGVESLWAVVSDVTAWPQHLPTFTSVTQVGEAGPLGVGSRVDVRQPGLPAGTYEVTAWVPGSSFTWVMRSPGIRTTATHRVSAGVGEGSRLDLDVTWSGPLAAAVRLVVGRRTRHLIELEARTLARVAEDRG